MRRSRPPATKRRLAESFLGVDRKGCQQDPRNRRTALEEVRLDVAKGADLVPVGAYHVSGEHATAGAAAEHGSLDRETVALEHLGAIKRAGAVILTYLTAEVAEALGG
jgi:porphobilinogen synthase